LPTDLTSNRLADFKRSLGLLDSVMIVSGSMIGSGIFIVTAGKSRDLGYQITQL
jgi:APA family basic amino acid/polyamine antiporter